MADEQKQAMRAFAEGRAAAPKLTPEEIKARNIAALQKRKAMLAEKKKAEATRALPEGWRRVESRSRPGEFVYENIHTEERQAWFPDVAAAEEAAAPLVAQSEDAGKKEALKKKNLEALKKRKQALQQQRETEKTMDVPDGWKRVESRSRPGEFVYENTVTGDRQAWFPDAPAKAGGADPKKMEKNKAALAAFKAKKDAAVKEEASKPLPEGWKRVESRSRPGEFVYENVHTEERQAWFPDTPAEPPLPAGWRKVESRTYPGEFVYENMHTFDRQAWKPTEAATTEPLKVPDQTPADRTKEQLAQIKSAQPVRNIVCNASALYDYAAQNTEEEIDLVEGDVIQVEYKAANGWWVGTNTRTNRNGIFPGTYVEEIKG